MLLESAKPLTLTATPIALPASALAKVAVVVPLTVEVSVLRRPNTVLVPAKVAVVVVSYTLLEAVKPLMVTGAAVMLAVNGVVTLAT